MPSTRQLVALLLVGLALVVGAGLARAGVVEVEGDIRFYIKPAPTAVIKAGHAGGPYASGPFYFDEPATVEFAAWAATDPNGGNLTFEWDFSYDTVQFNVEAAGPGPVTATYPDGPVDELVALRLTSDAGTVGYVIERIIVENVAPSVTLDGPYSASLNQGITFTAAATDPSASDTAAGLHYAWDFDYEGNAFTTDASGIGMNSVSHSYSGAGNYTVAVRVTDKDGGTRMTTAPVTAELVTTTVSLAAAQDSYVAESSAGNNFGGGDLMYVTADSSGGAARSLVTFDLSSIPSGATIVSATLKLYADSVPSGERGHLAYRVTETWSEGSVTWDAQPAVHDAASASADTLAAPGWMTWDVTGDAQSAVDGVFSYYGWLLQDGGENSGTDEAAAYRTKEHATTSHRPVLEVVYATS